MSKVRSNKIYIYGGFFVFLLGAFVSVYEMGVGDYVSAQFCILLSLVGYALLCLMDLQIFVYGKKDE